MAASCTSQEFTSIVIPEGVQIIKSGAFDWCLYLKEIILPSSLKDIGETAFRDCQSLEKIVLPENLENIGSLAFGNCHNLKKVVSHNPVPPTIKDNSFFYSYIDTLYVPYNAKSKYTNVQYWKNFKNIVELPPYDFESNGFYYNIISKEDQTCEVTYFDGSANNHYNNYKAYYGTVSIPSTTKYNDKTYDIIRIGDNAFNNCYNLDSIYIPNNIKSIGAYAFYNCYKLKNVKIPNSVTAISYAAFNRCSALNSVDLPKEIYEIGFETFANCTNLTSITIPQNVTRIANYAFSNCKNLSSIISLNSTPPEISKYVFWDNNSNEDCYGATLFVPYKTKSVYAIKEHWNNFNNIIEIVNTYKVEYSINNEIIYVDSVKEGSLIPTYIPQKDGYTFNGWENLPDIMPSNNIVVEGSYTVNEYLLSYIIDGSLYKIIRVNCDEKIENLQLEDREGYSFIWENWIDKMPAKDYSLRGKYIPNYYAITYIVDGNIFATDSIVYGDNIPLIDTPIKEGYTFSGWDSIPVTMPAADVIVSGTFAVNSYKVTYTIDGEIFATDSIVYGDSIPLIAAPEKEGYTFSGWGDAPATMPAEDVTISGAFAVNYYKVTYIVDKEIFATDSVAYGSEIKLIAAPEKEGYTFYGWSDAPTTMPAADVTINGSFEVNTYAVTYIVDGDTVAVDSVAYGAEITPIAAPVKEGYTFSGWSEAPATMPANDIVISGSFEINTYVVTYIVDGKTYATDSIVFNGDVNVISAPTKEGYTFSGWSYAPKKMPAEDIVISGTFSVNYYTITYLVDGEEYKSEQVAYGTEIKLLDAPVKEGYTFSGWSDAPMTMPAEDITIIGSFVATGISNVSADAAVKVNGNSITLFGANNSIVTIYSTSGALVEKIDSYAGEEIVLGKGVYIVRVGNKTMKVKL